MTALANGHRSTKPGRLQRVTSSYSYEVTAGIQQPIRRQLAASVRSSLDSPRLAVAFVNGSHGRYGAVTDMTRSGYVLQQSLQHGRRALSISGAS